jgi:hypothetical protein
VGSKPGHIQGYAVIRIDDGPVDHPSSVQEFMLEGVLVPAPGPSNVTVKEVVASAEEAHREVARLNTLNAGKGCRYFWQATRVFLDGGSHGSKGRAAQGGPDAEPLYGLESQEGAPRNGTE